LPPAARQPPPTPNLRHFLIEVQRGRLVSPTRIRSRRKITALTSPAAAAAAAAVVTIHPTGTFGFIIARQRSY